MADHGDHADHGEDHGGEHGGDHGDDEIENKKKAKKLEANKKKEVQFSYSKMRKEFGQPLTFTDSPPNLEVDIKPNPELKANFVRREEEERETTCIPSQSEHQVNTPITQMKTTSMFHFEGGWPKSTDPTDVEKKILYRKKIEKDTSYVNTILNLGETMKRLLMINNAVDIYQIYYSEDLYKSQPYENEPPELKMLNDYLDQAMPKREVSSICWIPGTKTPERFAVAYSYSQYQKDIPENSCTDSYIWHVEKPIHPETVIKAPHFIMNLEYAHKEHNILIGGLHNGQVAYWDIRKSARAPIDSTPIPQSHWDPCYKARWLPSKTGTEAVSISTDGSTRWWDTRKLTQPVDMMWIDTSKGNSEFEAQGCMSLEIDMATASRCLVGTEQGNVVNINTKTGKTPGEHIVGVFNAHSAPVYSIERHPHNPKNFLTIGDWCAKIFSEEIMFSSIFLTPPGDDWLLDGAWSPTRSAVFFTGGLGGTVRIYDLLTKHDEPVITYTGFPRAVQVVRPHEAGKHVVVGTRGGRCTLISLSDSLAKPIDSERKLFAEMLQREKDRETMVEKAEGLLELAMKRAHEGTAEYDPSTDEKRKFWKPGDVLTVETSERFDDTKKTYTEKWSREAWVRKNAATKKTNKKNDDDDDDFDFEDLDAEVPADNVAATEGGDAAAAPVAATEGGGEGAPAPEAAATEEAESPDAADDDAAAAATAETEEPEGEGAPSGEGEEEGQAENRRLGSEDAEGAPSESGSAPEDSETGGGGGGAEEDSAETETENRSSEGEEGEEGQ